MLARLIDFSLHNRFFVLVAIALVAISGVVSAIRLPIDAVPDMTNVQVAVITDAGSLSPVEVERYVTYPGRIGDGGSAECRGTAQRLQVRHFGGHDRVRRKHRHLLRPPSGFRATECCAKPLIPAGLRHAGDRTADDGTGRNPAVRGSRRRLIRRCNCGRFWSGTSRRGCAKFAA